MLVCCNLKFWSFNSQSQLACFHMFSGLLNCLFYVHFLVSYTFLLDFLKIHFLLFQGHEHHLMCSISIVLVFRSTLSMGLTLWGCVSGIKSFVSLLCFNVGIQSVLHPLLSGLSFLSIINWNKKWNFNKS